MNIERGIRRLVIVVSGLILAVGMFAVVAGGDIGLATVIVGVLLGLLWGTFFTLRWVARGFRADPNPPARRPQITADGPGGGLLLGRAMGTFMAWLLFALMGVGLVFLVVAVLLVILTTPKETWADFVTQFLEPGTPKCVTAQARTHLRVEDC
jgi:hypothetical protein